MRKELDIFFAGLMFYTRLPIPKWVNHHPSYLNKATKYFPLIGWIVASLAALILCLTSLILPFSICLIISMAASILVTGAFHEDGFSDTCDGFGGGWTQEHILDIMKDSRIGVFGAIGIILMLMGKYVALSEMNIKMATIALFIAHPMSRWAAVITVATSKYVQQDAKSKAKPIATAKPKVKDLILASLFGLLPLLIWGSWLQIILAIPTVLFTRWLLTRFFQKWIGGYTGDCLGATQQLCEIVIYFTLLIKIPQLFE